MSLRGEENSMVVQLHVGYAWWSLYCCLVRLIGAELLFYVKLKPNLVLWLFTL
ncbi:hypothetical protein Scep_001078 [Stephania cephalantha]|uniref:Uncharacterized protein n=1 Tax=Stephania cephalantha TaxID=152367 RepID=A0AAP0L8S8_9MAGN